MPIENVTLEEFAAHFLTRLTADRDALRQHRILCLLYTSRCVEGTGTVVACARGEAGLAELRVNFPVIETHACDMRDVAAVDALANAVLARHGAVDLLVNNAGAYRPGQISNEDDDALLDMLQANLFGAYRLTKRLLPAMMKRRSGMVLNVFSTCLLYTSRCL